MNILAELKEVKMNKTASLDRQFRIVLLTDNPLVKELMEYSPETLFKVEIRGENETGE